MYQNFNFNIKSLKNKFYLSEMFMKMLKRIALVMTMMMMKRREEMDESGSSIYCKH